jgi:acyl-CoA synthetase (NDP forming)
VKAAAAAVAAGWQTKRNKKQKKQSKRTAEELRLKAQSKAPQQHVSNRERRQLNSGTADNASSAAEAVVQEMTPEMIERLAGIEPEPTSGPWSIWARSPFD